MATNPAVEQGATSNPISAWALNERHSVAERLLPEKFSSLVDVGCGEGHFIGRIMKIAKGVRVLGIDLHPTNISSARKEFGAMFSEGSAEQLPAKDSSFEVASLLEVLDHLENPKKALLEIRRVLKPGGFLILSIPDESRITWRLIWGFWSGTVGRRWHHAHISSYSEESLRVFLTQNGFFVDKVERALFGCIITVRAKSTKSSRSNSTK